MLAIVDRPHFTVQLTSKPKSARRCDEKFTILRLNNSSTDSIYSVMR